MRFNQSIVLIAVKTALDPISGGRTPTITSHKTLMAGVAPVGAYTKWNAHSQDIEISAVFQIKARAYANHKYVYVKQSDKLYEINDIGKGERVDLYRLNCVDSNENTVKEAIKNVLSN